MKKIKIIESIVNITFNKNNMNTILQHKEKLNKIFIKKYTNFNYDDKEAWDTNCHITKKLLIHLLECVVSEKAMSNFQTIYFEYKGIGHSCCVYKNKILQSFAGHHYLKFTNLQMSFDELYQSIDKHIDLFFPKNFIDLDKEVKLYTSIKYYYTSVDNSRIVNNLNKLLS